MKSLISTAAVLSTTLALATQAPAASTFIFNANQNYYSAANSPFNAMTDSLVLENFESGALSVAGVRARGGSVMGPSRKTDSVDGDTGSINGSGRGGHSFTSGNSKQITFRFQSAGSGLPTMAGLVWTDGRPNSRIVFRAWDQNNQLLGRIRVTLGDLVRNGTTAEDRFLGVVNESGISRIQIKSNFRNFEVDHLQFSYAMGFSVVPVPPALGLGLAGLAGLAIVKRRRNKKA